MTNCFHIWGNAEHLKKFIVECLGLTPLVPRVFPFLCKPSETSTDFVPGETHACTHPPFRSRSTRNIDRNLLFNPAYWILVLSFLIGDNRRELSERQGIITP